MRDRNKRKIVVEIDNLTEAQEIALNDLFATWQQLGSWGSSRWTAFFADGDGDFRPKITINGEKAKFTELVDRKKLWQGDEYRIDFDGVGWALQAIEDRETTCTEDNPDRTKKYHDFGNTRAHGDVCNNCGLPYKESQSYRPPTDWSKPHHFMAPEGWDSPNCPDCGKDYNDPVHLHGGQLGPPETAESAG